MTDGIQQLKSALGEIPSLLLDDDLAAVRDDALAAVDELEVFVPEPAVIVVVGASGAGKSSVVNAIIGSDVAAVSPLRPTTTAVSAIGGSEASLVQGATELVLTDAVADGLVVVDTPPWDMASDHIKTMVVEADLVVVVVTPARYGDEQTVQAIAAATEATEWRLVVNRLPVIEAEREQLLDAIHERLGVAPEYSVVEGEAIQLDGIADDVKVDETAVARRATLAATAGRIARSLATSLTERATEVGELAGAIVSVQPTTFTALTLDDAVDWDGARADLIAAAVGAVAAWERKVAVQTGSSLAARVADALGPPDTIALESELDVWRTDTSQRFQRRSTIWLRRKSGHELLDRWSWISAVNPEEPLPRRVRRMMGDALEPTSRKARSDLVGILVGLMAGRPEAWSESVDRAGEYRPGMLLAAADAVDRQSTDANRADG